MPDLTFDRSLNLNLGGKNIDTLYLGAGHPVVVGPSEFKTIIKKNREVWSTMVPSLCLSEDIYK
jgi:coproporphyrinogen III oxidase-like Fe-S oxidoreductase